MVVVYIFFSSDILMKEKKARKGWRIKEKKWNRRKGGSNLGDEQVMQVFLSS